VQAIENQQQPAAARQQPRGTRPEPAAKAEPTPSVAPVAQEVPPQPGAQEVAEQPAPNATASAAVATVKTPEPSVALDSKGVSDAIARAGRLLSKGEIVESEALLRAVLAKEPDEHHAMEVLIRILLKRGRGGEAIPFAKRIVEKRPRRAPYRLLYGDVLAAIGQQSSAEEQWQEALSIEPNSSAAKRRLGQ
jgi:predicted Zn-dependent protease